MRTSQILALGAILSVGAGACSSGPGDGVSASVTGTVSYLLRIALAPDAVVTVRLQDTSLRNVAATLVGEQIQNADGRQVPIPFEVAYDPADIVATNTYTVSATIEEGGRITWRSTTAFAVITRGAPTSDVAILVDQLP